MDPGRNRELRETREKNQAETGTQWRFGSFSPFAYLACFAVKKNEPPDVGLNLGLLQPPMGQFDILRNIAMMTALRCPEQKLAAL